MKNLEYDTAHILQEHQQLLKMLFEYVDMTKVVFVGGIADYLNLRPEFEMPVNDLDLCFRSKDDIAEFERKFPMERHQSIYVKDATEVYTGECVVNGKSIHVDFFQKDSIYIHPISKSELLGVEVLHTSFEGMKAFHNEYVALMSSEAQGEKYDWKRLYKHSRKASLYNLMAFRNEKELQAV